MSQSVSGIEHIARVGLNFLFRVDMSRIVLVPIKVHMHRIGSALDLEFGNTMAEHTQRGRQRLVRFYTISIPDLINLVVLPHEYILQI